VRKLRAEVKVIGRKTQKCGTKIESGTGTQWEKRNLRNKTWKQGW